MKPLQLAHITDPDVAASQLIAELRAKGKGRLADAAAALWVQLRKRGAPHQQPTGKTGERADA